MSQTRTEGEANALRAEFFGWQCRLRQHVMRYAAGRPAPGLRPEVILPNQETAATRLIVLINKSDLKTYARQFRHMVLRTQDPNERYDSALNYFKAAYYQRGHEFDEQLTALVGPDSIIATDLIEASACRLEFDQFSQRFAFNCEVTELPEHDDRYQVTYWHNRLFNPKMPAGVRVLAFKPDWQTATSLRTSE